MRTKTLFRPTVDRAEPRILMTAGLAHHPAASIEHAHIRAVTVAIESSHPKHHATPKYHAATVSAPVANPTPPTSTTLPASPPSDSLPGAQAWIKLINTTATTINYRLSLAPYDNGTFRTYSADPIVPQYRFTQLTQTGPNSVSDIKIQFGSQAPISLTSTGASATTAQGYYVFIDGTGQYYVQPLIS